MISWEGLTEGLGNGGSSCTPSPSGCRERLLLRLEAATQPVTSGKGFPGSMPQSSHMSNAAVRRVGCSCLSP